MTFNVTASHSDLLTQIGNNASFYAPEVWGFLELRGEDRDRFLHNQTTNNINALTPGYHCLTTFVNSTGRTLELATIYKHEDSLLIQVSAQKRLFLYDWMDRYIFPMDKVDLKDLSNQYRLVQVVGSEVENGLKTAGLTLPQPNQQINLTWLDQSLIIAAGNDLDLPGFTLIIPTESYTIITNQLQQSEFQTITEPMWEYLRIHQGRPMANQELTEDYNPLEAGLWRTISFDKGCYIGQETIARLNTYQGVKQRLWGLKLNQTVPIGTVITLGAEKVGLLTSITDLETPFGLGYIRTKAGGEGLQVQIGDAIAEVISVPFLKHEYQIFGDKKTN